LPELDGGLQRLTQQMLPCTRVAVLILLAAAPAAGQQPAPPTLRDDAQALLRRGIPVALILGPGLQDALNERAAQPGGPDRGDDRRALLTGVAARWAGRVDVFDDGTVVTLRARTPSCLPQLDRRLETTGLEAPPVEIVQGIAARLNPALRGLPPPGMMGGGISSPDPDAETARDRELDGRTVAMVPIALDGGQSSLQAALNQLVIKAGRLGWAIGSERAGDGRHVCRIALLTRSTTVLTFWDIPAP
jgi:hypothetical protein